MVIDSSVIVAALLDTAELGTRARSSIRGKRLIAPQGVDLEVISAIRGLNLGGEFDEQAASQSVDAFRRMRIARTPISTLITRIWQLRHNISPYDAAFVALAEALDAPLLTYDTKLARAAGPRCQIVLP